jgi:hypothetical protein
MEGMESRENFFQLTQANVTDSALHAIANKNDGYPNGRKKTNAAGLKTKAATSRATVVVYVIPVDFWHESNIATPSVVRC